MPRRRHRLAARRAGLPLRRDPRPEARRARLPAGRGGRRRRRAARRDAAPRSPTPCARAARWSRCPTRRSALGALAAGYRNTFHGPSSRSPARNGKTTTKEMCAAILAVRAPCLKTEGNLNNQYGLPLTLLRRDESHRARGGRDRHEPRGRDGAARGDRAPDRRRHHQRRHRAHREPRLAGRDRGGEGSALRGARRGRRRGRELRGRARDGAARAHQGARRAPSVAKRAPTCAPNT